MPRRRRRDGKWAAGFAESLEDPGSRDVARDARARRSPAESLLEGSVARTSLGALNNRNTARHDNPPRLCSTPRDSQTNVATLRNAVSEQDSPPTSRGGSRVRLVGEARITNHTGSLVGSSPATVRPTARGPLKAWRTFNGMFFFESTRAFSYL